MLIPLKITTICCITLSGVTAKNPFAMITEGGVALAVVTTNSAGIMTFRRPECSGRRPNRDNLNSAST